jgi:autotransporter passenger strand-loop-strand repeat protein
MPTTRCGTEIGAAISSGGTMNVSSGGIASGTQINSNGLEVDFSDGTDFGATVSEGGNLFPLRGYIDLGVSGGQRHVGRWRPRNRFFRWHGIGHHLVAVGPIARLLRRSRYKHH